MLTITLSNKSIYVNVGIEALLTATSIDEALVIAALHHALIASTMNQSSTMNELIVDIPCISSNLLTHLTYTVDV